MTAQGKRLAVRFATNPEVTSDMMMIVELRLCGSLLPVEFWDSSECTTSVPYQKSLCQSFTSAGGRRRTTGFSIVRMC